MLLDMKRFLTLSILLLAAVSANAGKIVTDSLYSHILKASVKYNVYLPDGFDESVKTYPVVYLLHGLGGNYTDWAKKASAKASISTCQVGITKISSSRNSSLP